MKKTLCSWFCILPLFLGLVPTGVSSAPSEASTTQPCPLEGIEILGGSFKLLKDGQFLEYVCPSGYYPYPVKVRSCKPWGSWSTLQTRNKKIVKKAECKAIQCPGPEDFENGDFWPRKRFYNISDQIFFQCYDGYTLRGSDNRICQSSGRWDGFTAICDAGVGHCRDPGIPIGTRKAGRQYRLEDSVTYHCGQGLTLQGSQRRTCMEDGSWSGTEPSCQDSFMYDTSEEVFAAFISSLTEMVEGADAEDGHSPGEQQKRKIVLDPSGSMNMYLVLDASDSIGKNNFTGAKKCFTSLIEKVASYGVKPRYAVVTYATEAKAVVRLSDERSSDADWVTQQLEKIQYKDHESKSGTNTKRALTLLYEMMIAQESSKNDYNWNQTRHVIVLMTDGNYNMGGDPVAAIEQIREFLDIGRNRRNPREDYLDVYVFGIGPLVDQEKINALASKKDGEKHVFKVKDMEDLERVFSLMIDESKTLGLCGIAWGHQKSGHYERQPWHVTINVIRSTGKEACKGAVVSEYFLLTAAHCFNVDDQAHSIKVDAGGMKNREVDAVYFHPDYDINRKKAEGIPEFYDYDIALVKLKKKFIFSKDLRPICLPCTEATTRALRLPTTTTCQQQEKELLPEKNVKALFVFQDKNLIQKEVYIKNGEMKENCERDALKAQGYEKVKQVSDVVTPRFLCTGGTEPNVDPNTCKGDSGGPLIIHKKSRFIQVGVISWGVVDVCKNPKRLAPSHARDFHINLFQVLPWLQEKLKDEDLGFL